MNTVSSTAPILVVDLQTGMLDGIAEPALRDAEALVARVCDILSWAREQGRPIAFIRHDGPAGDPLAPGQPGWPVSPALGQREEEPTFGKTIGDAFSNPDLADWLRRLDAGEIVLVGAQTNFCIAATLSGALAAGLKVTIVSDGHSTVDLPDKSAEQIILRYNAQFAEAGARLVTTAQLLAGS
ncbi:cysteine hydrolase [Rhizobium deserti]|uniref:Cysteine hydrolase n=1 Tax=Rhizobium deserti TaxID=2547961 RepID=A0A4R5UAT8_9HYPH|nr:cysteine hydrolase family protein [Rhizobium deserti]TDK31804.1 cysteine hydrolase [Rhizobium deserti]